MSRRQALDSKKNRITKTLPDRRKAEKIIPPVHPNFGIEKDYRTTLVREIDAMARSIEYFVKAAYRKDPPELAQDATPAANLRKAVNKLAKQWQKRFDNLSKQLADHFAEAVQKRSKEGLRSALRRSGIAVKFEPTAAERDVMAASVAENVQLIKSIPEQYLLQVQGSVMRSVQTGRDLGQLTEELQKHHGVTRRRAAFIARDQNNKATAAMTRARQAEMGITTAVWQHSAGGKHPRPSHVANSGKRYDISTGWYDPDAKVYTWPGVLPNCRCVSRTVIEVT